MGDLVQDLRQGARRLLRSPGFSVVAVLTLALGIGANSAIFSVVNAVLLRPLPFVEPDRLVQLFNVRGDDDRFLVAPPNFLDFREQTRLFSGVGAFRNRDDFTLTGVGDPARIRGAVVSADLLGVLGATPALGRGFSAEENEPGRGDVVILSHALWAQRYGSDPAVVGRTVTLDGTGLTVVGVMPPGFDYPAGAALWTPLVFDGYFRNPENRGAHQLSVVARLQPGATPEGAAVEMRALGDRIAREVGGSATNSSANAVPLREVMVGDSRAALLVLLAAVGLVLLIACANVANLLLSRAAAREGEMAVRVALGAGRGRLVRQLLSESLLLALAGGSLGLLLAWWGTGALVALGPEGIPQLDRVSVDPAVIAFTACVSLLTGLLFGLAPAVQGTRSALAGSLRDGARGTVSGRRGNGVRGALVVAETALAVMLLAGAGLLVRSFVQLVRVDPGFRTEGVLSVNLTLPGASYGEREAVAGFHARLLDRVVALPGVSSAGAVSGLPLGGRGSTLGIYPADEPEPEPGTMPVAQMRVASPDYFPTLGIPVLRGRGFTPADRAGAPPVVMLTERAAERLFPGEDPLGRRVLLTSYLGPNPEDQLGGEVVGIVGSVRQAGLDQEPEPEVYLPLAQAPFPSVDLALRTEGDPMALAAAVRGAVRELDPDLPVDGFRTVEQLVSESVAQPRFYMLLLSLFAALALTLAAVGIFGVVSYGVAQRTREIGIRMAMGADPGAVLRLMVGGGMRLVLLGIAIGMATTLALARLLETMLYGVGATDPLTLAAVALSLAGVALLACYLPARRAIRIEPTAALRAE